MEKLGLKLPGIGEILPPTGVPKGGLLTEGQDIIKVGITLFLIIIVLLALLYILWGGIRYITSRGDKQKIEGAREKITYAIVGVVVAFFAFLIINTTGQFFNVNLLAIVVPSPAPTPTCTPLGGSCSGATCCSPNVCIDYLCTAPTPTPTTGPTATPTPTSTPAPTATPVPTATPTPPCVPAGDACTVGGFDCCAGLVCPGGLCVVPTSTPAPTPTPLPLDLQIFALMFTPTGPTPGEDIDFTVQVQNVTIAGVTSPATTVKFYERITAPSCVDQAGSFGEVNIVPLVQNAIAERIFIKVGGFASGTHTVWVFVDPTCAIGELNEGNNTQSITVVVE